MWLLGLVKKKKTTLSPPDRRLYDLLCVFLLPLPPSMTFGLSSHVTLRHGAGRTGEEQNHHKDI